MIRYRLKCAAGHEFESWFKNADAFDKLKGRGLVECATCGSTEIEKALMAPGLGALSDEAGKARRKAAADLRAKGEDVGPRFAEEARAIHNQERPERLIYGKANREEVRELLEDGVPVAPAPFLDHDS
ncbi:DUF1178 family protein [Paracoccaceae bacterium GXU_MW_L88]